MQDIKKCEKCMFFSIQKTKGSVSLKPFNKGYCISDFVDVGSLKIIDECDSFLPNDNIQN